MSYQGSKGFVELFEDFTEGTVISTTAAAGISFLNSSDTGNTAFVETVGIIGGEGSAQAATDTTDNDMCELAHGFLQWYAGLDCMMEVRMQMDVISNVAFNIGFNDDALEDSNTLPVELATTTWTTNATTWVGFVYDTDATTQGIYVMSVDDDSDNTSAIGDLLMTSALPVAATYGTYVVQNYRGTSHTAQAITEWTAIPNEDNPATQYRKRSGQGNLNATTIDGDSPQTPHIAFENRSGTAHTCNVDYVLARQRRSVDTNN